MDSIRISSGSNEKVYKFVITGGPCSGKTTAMERLPVFLRERGFRVFIAQEAATMLFVNGASIDDFAKDGCPYAFQQFVIKTQQTLEDSLYNYAKATQQSSVILCDRGIMDGSAYIDSDSFQSLLKEVNMDLISARDGRYDAVFHLVSAADGAESFYTLENNSARSESPEEAKRLDNKTQMVWMGHPHHVIIDNKNKSFERKLEELIAAVAQRVGLPSLRRRAHKYRLLQPPDLYLLPNVQTFDVEKIILNPAQSVGGGETGTEIKRTIRKRSQGRLSSYGLTVVKRLPSGEKVELKQVISAKMYNTLATSAADKERAVIHQKRFCFLWETQSFHVYQYLKPQSGLWLLFCQSDGEPHIPPFLQVGEEIDENDTLFSSHSLSKLNLSDGGESRP